MDGHAINKLIEFIALSCLRMFECLCVICVWTVDAPSTPVVALQLQPVGLRAVGHHHHQPLFRPRRHTEGKDPLFQWCRDT